MTDITELAQSLKAAADREMICLDGAETSEIWERTVTPENILALVEALESEKRICATWRKTAESTGEKLEKAQAAERRWHRVASRVHEQACESDVKIDELEAIRAAAEKLVRCKGRYHSEQNYRALAALFGVTTPDLPPLDSETRTVTVKLPDNCEHDVIAPVSAFMYGVGFEIDTEDYNSLTGRVRREIETVVRRTLRTAGIKWEVE